MVALDLDLNNLSPGTKQGTISIVQAFYGCAKAESIHGFQISGWNVNAKSFDTSAPPAPPPSGFTLGLTSAASAILEGLE